MVSQLGSLQPVGFYWDIQYEGHGYPSIKWPAEEEEVEVREEPGEENKWDKE